jgi:prepilin-type N-terminal cleavage/methylation domain-containing protein
MRNCFIQRRRTGLSLVEVLISLAISAMLLSAVAAAFHASASVVDMNDQFFRASQAARISLNQIVAHVRQCQSLVVDTDSMDITTDTGTKITYELSGTDLNLIFTPPGASSPVTTRLASNIKKLRFDTDQKSVSMLIVIEIGSNQITLCGSALPRRSVTYN